MHTRPADQSESSSESRPCSRSFFFVVVTVADAEAVALLLLLLLLLWVVFLVVVVVEITGAGAGAPRSFERCRAANAFCATTNNQIRQRGDTFARPSHRIAYHGSLRLVLLGLFLWHPPVRAGSPLLRRRLRGPQTHPETSSLTNKVPPVSHEEMFLSRSRETGTKHATVAALSESNTRAHTNERLVMKDHGCRGAYCCCCCVRCCGHLLLFCSCSCHPICPFWAHARSSACHQP